MPSTVYRRAVTLVEAEKQRSYSIGHAHRVSLLTERLPVRRLRLHLPPVHLHPLLYPRENLGLGLVEFMALRDVDCQVIESEPRQLRRLDRLGAYQDTTSRDYAEPAGGWTWVTGEPFAFTAWGGRNTPEPSNVYLGGLGDAPIGHSEEAMQYWSVQPPRWNDVPRHPDVRLPYIIESDTQPRH